MNSSQLTDRIASSHGLGKPEAKKIIESVLDAIIEAAMAGEEVSLHGFGKFKVKATAAREGRNPATGAVMTIKAGKKLAFVPGKTLKDRLVA
ncbi:HU family DNA-binding protein [Sphingomonas solaris]|uniref:HU family DNA-binding protein n=2 Tax=Alterirhizorhabdus solaris TaxID=2529389 RepID=A0A558RAQ0_9SPHN|nr:HU family DNA-binding protein [Sphingomonas solaris]